MKKIHMIAAALAMFMPTMLWAGSHSTHYGKIAVEVATGEGTVYVSTSATATSGQTSGTWDCGGNSSGDSKTWYIYAKSNSEDWEFKGWSTTKTGTPDGNTTSPVSRSLSASGTSSDNPSTTTYYAHFKSTLRDPFDITFAPGNYMVDGVAVESINADNYKGLRKVKTVALSSSDENFLNWLINNESVANASHTLTCESDTTVEAVFLTSDQVTTVTTIADLTSALSNAAYKKIIIPSGTSLTVAKGSTVTVPAGKQLVVDGDLWVEGTLSVLGNVVANGAVSKCTYAFVQEGDSGEPVNPYEGVRYWRTKTETVSAAISGFTGAKSHVKITNGMGFVSRHIFTTSSPAMLVCNVDSTVAINHVTGVKGEYASDAFTSAASSSTSQMILLLSNLTVSFSKNSKYTSNAGILDCAGKTFTLSQYARGGYQHTILNGTAKWTEGSSTGGFYGKCKCINCSSVTVANAVNSGANWIEFYDCTPAKFITSMEDSTSTSFKVRYYSGGPYNPSTFTGVAGCYELYGGYYTSQPEDARIAPEISGTHEFRQNPTDHYWYLMLKGEDVAQVGNAKYQSFDEAFTAAMKLDAATITILKNTTVDKSYTIGLEKSLCIEFAGCKIVSTVEDAFLKNYGTLELGDKFGNFNTAGIEAETVLENHGMVDVCYGAYTGNIRLSGGTFTTHHGLFDGSLIVDDGLDVQTVADIRGGVFTSTVANLLRDGIVQNYYQKGTDPKRYWVGKFPQSITTETSISGMEKGWSLDFLSAKNLRLYKNASTDRSAYEGVEWQEKAELNASLEAYLNYVLDCSIGFDVAVEKKTVTIYAPYVNGKELDKNLSANERYSLVVPNFGAGYTPWTFDDYIANVGTSQCGVADGSGAKNTGAVFDVRVQLCDWNKDTQNQQVTTVHADIAICRYMLGGKKAAIDRNGNRLAYDSLEIAVSAANDGETVLVGANTDADVTLAKAGTFTIDPYGFNWTGSASITDNTLFLKSQTESTSLATTGQDAPSANATTYVVAQKVASVGEMFYDNLTEAVSAANGAVVTLLAATDETVALGQGQSLKLAVASGVSYDAASKIVVDSSLTGYGIKATAGDGYTLYEVVQSTVSSGGSNYASVEDAISDASGDTVEVTVTADITETVSLDAGKTLSVTVADGVSGANVTVEPVEGAFIDATTDGNTTTYESKKITVEMATPQATVEMTKIESGTETTVSDSTEINAAVTQLMGNHDVPRTDNTDKLDVLDNITITPTKIVQEVVGAAAAFIRSATFDVVPTFKVGQSLGAGQKLKFRLPVDAAATQFAAIVYHGTAQFGIYPVQAYNNEKFVEVESDTFSPYGYELLDGETANPVAAIGTTGYATLAAAVAAVPDGSATTITMLADTAESVTIPGGKSVVLDLNGKTVSCANSTPTISVSANGSLAVADSSTGTSGGVQNTAANGVAIYCDAGSVTVNSGTVGSLDTYRGIVVDHVGTVVVNDGRVIASNAAIRSTSTAHDVITINGGTIGDPTTDYAVYDYDYATITIHGGVLNADKIAIAAFGSTLTIDGGEINKYGNTEYAILLGEAGTAMISAGTINSAYTGIYVGDTGTTLNITGGTITAAGEATILTNGTKNEAAVINISGGTVANTGTGSAIYQPNRGATVNISDNAVVTGPTGVILKGGTLNVFGGTISGTGVYRAPAAMSSGGTSTGDAVYVEDTYSENGNYKPTVNITGGTFNSANGYAAQYYTQAAAVTESQANGSINISGNPTLTSSKQTDAVNSTALPNKVNIAGGSFAHAVPEEYCADGYIPAAQDTNTGLYSVKTGSYVAQNMTTDTKYESFGAALAEALSGDTVQLLADITGVTETYNIDKTLTIDGQGQYKIVAGPNPEPRNVISAWSGPRVMFDLTRSTANVTFNNITMDNGEGHYYSYFVRAKSGTATFEDVVLLRGAEKDSSGTAGAGYGAAILADGGNIVVKGDFYADTHGEPLEEDEQGDKTAGIFPFTAILHQDGGIYFNDDVTANIGQDLLLVGKQNEDMLDASDETVKAQIQAMLDEMNVPAGYVPYTLNLADSAQLSFIGASPLGWNNIIDYGKGIMDVAADAYGMTELDKTTTPVEVGLLDDTVLTETFTYEDSNFTVNGNGNTLSGTIEYTDNAGTLENVVMGTEEAPLVLDMTGLSEGKSMDLGSGIAASNVTIKVTEEQVATMGTTIVTWNTEGQDEGEGESSEPFESGITVTVVDKDTGDPVIDEGTGQPKEASLVWDDEYGRAYVGPCEARLTGPTHADPIYTSLANAIALAAQSGDTVTLLMDIANFTGTQEIYKSLTLDGAGHTIAAAPVSTHRDIVNAWAGSTSMFKLETGEITFRNITLNGDATHAYTFLVSADNSGVSLTTENIRLLNGGELCGDANGAIVEQGAGYGAAIHLNNGVSLVVSNGFYACSGGKTDGCFPFTGILVDENGGDVKFELTGNPNDPANVDIGGDLLLVGMPGVVPLDQTQDMLDYMKVPTRFIPYTLTLDDGSAYAFTGASPLGWNEIIDYGKEIMDVSTAIGYEGLDKDTTPVEVGLLEDTILPDTFTYEDSNFTVNGNGNALSGTIEYTDDAGVIENIVFGTEEEPLVLDLRNVTDPVVIGNAITVTNVMVLMTEEQAVLGQPVFMWNTETADEPENSDLVTITVMPDAQSEPQGDEPEKGLVWDDELGLAYIGPCEARLTGPSREMPAYTSLSNAVVLAAASGDTVTLMTNVTLTAEQTIDKSIVFNLNGKALVADGDALRIDSNAAVQMFGAGIVTGNVFVASGTLTITNGVYIGTIGKTSGDVAQIVISGGLFSNKVPAEYCAEGYFPTEQNSDGLYTVTQGYAKGDKPVIAGADTHALTKSEADFLNSLLVKGYDKATVVDAALADASSIGAFRDAAMLNIDITQDYADPVFRISAIKRSRAAETVTVTVSLDRDGKEVSKKIYGTLVLKTSSDAHAWSSCTGAVADDASDDDLANFSENGETVSFTMPISGNGHIFKATFSPVED